MPVPTVPLQSPPPSVELAQKNPLLAPLAIAAFVLGVPSPTAPLQIQLHFDSGCALDVPLTQGAIDNLARVLDLYRTKP